MTEEEKEKKREKKKQEKERIKREEKNVREVSKALVEMNIKDTIFGPTWMKYDWFQSFATRRMYLVVYTFIGLVIGTYFTYSVSTISTIEKRFKVNSKITGIMLAGNDISQVMFSIFISYYCNYGNRPKWVGLGILSASLACFLSALPHFIYGPGEDALEVAMNSFTAEQSITDVATPEPSDKSTGLCYAPYEGNCDEESIDMIGSILGPFIILFAAQFCVGLAITVFYSIGFIYLDDNVNKKDTPLYYALSMIVRVGGPVLGYFLGSKCLSYYIDPRYEPNISLRDPRWLGAWWLGYLLLMVLLGVLGLVMLLFPRTLPITMYNLMKVELKKENPRCKEEVTKNSDLNHLLSLVKNNQRKVKPTLKDLPKAFKRLFTNKVYVGHVMNTCLDLFALVGYWNFKPKYVEYQFRMSASLANLYTGVAGLISSIVGLALSGIIIRVFRPRPRVVAGYTCFLTLFSSASMLVLMTVRCPPITVIGPGYQGNATLSSDCSADCECSDRYSPVCSADGSLTFYSPCYAGCTEVNEKANPVEYYNCKCIAPIQDPSLNTSIVGLNEEKVYGNAIRGYCPEKCDSFFYYIITVTVTKMISSTGRIGGTLMYLRAIEDHDKGIAMGTFTVLISLLSFIPAPIIMGAIVDSACIIWDNTCGKKGNCWLYDSDKFRILIHAVPAAVIALAVIGDLIVFFNSANVKLYGEEDEEEPEVVENTEELELQPLKSIENLSEMPTSDPQTSNGTFNQVVNY